MTTVIQSFGDELSKLAGESPVRVRFKDFSLRPASTRTTRVQSAPREFAKLTPKFKQLTSAQQKTERVAPGAYTHRARVELSPLPKFLTPKAWTRKEVSDIREGTSPIAKVKAAKRGAK